MATTIDKLPVPQSRAEEFLENLCRNGVGGGSGGLPVPQSRLEEFLEYLCQNGVGGLTEQQIKELINQVLQVQVGNEANKIPRLEPNGKLATSIIPDLAITSVQSVTDQNSALQMVANEELQTGDVVILTQEENKIYMHNGTTTGGFSDQFIELSLGNGVIKNVNGQSADSTGKVTLNATVTQEATGDIVLAVGDQANFATIQCMTNTEVQAIINQLV